MLTREKLILSFFKSGELYIYTNSTLVELTINSTASINRNYNVNSTVIELVLKLHSRVRNYMLEIQLYIKLFGKGIIRSPE